MKDLVTGSTTCVTKDAMADNQGGQDNGATSRGRLLSRPQITIHSLNSDENIENSVPPSPRVTAPTPGRDLHFGNRVDVLGLPVDEEATEESAQDVEKYALDNAPPPIKVRRDGEGETSEDPCPSPPPSPKRMRELSRKDAIHSLPFSKVFSQGSI